jgi:hypothetical protein
MKRRIVGNANYMPKLTKHFQCFIFIEQDVMLFAKRHLAFLSSIL